MAYVRFLLLKNQNAGTCPARDGIMSGNVSRYGRGRKPALRHREVRVDRFAEVNYRERGITDGESMELDLRWFNASLLRQKRV